MVTQSNRRLDIRLFSFQIVAACRGDVCDYGDDAEVDAEGGLTPIIKNLAIAAWSLSPSTLHIITFVTNVTSTSWPPGASPSKLSSCGNVLYVRQQTVRAVRWRSPLEWLPRHFWQDGHGVWRNLEGL